MYNFPDIEFFELGNATAPSTAAVYHELSAIYNLPIGLESVSTVERSVFKDTRAAATVAQTSTLYTVDAPVAMDLLKTALPCLPFGHPKKELSADESSRASHVQETESPSGSTNGGVRRRNRSVAFYGGQPPDLGDVIMDLPPLRRTDDNAPRARPPPPTPITLPAYSVESAASESPIDHERINQLFVQTYLTKWTPEHHRALGVRLVNGIYIEDLVPTSYIPPKAWEEKPAPEQSGQRELDTSRPSSESLSNGAAIPGHEAFFVRVSELKHDREDALNALARRRPAAGKAPIRLSHYRRFWQSLENVSCYWDTSKDDYRPAGAPDPMDVDQIKTASQSSTHETESTPSASETNPAPPEANDERLSRLREVIDTAIHQLPGGQIEPKTSKSRDHASQPAVKDYYGLRTADGKAMENAERRDLVYNFVVPIVQAVGCHYEPAFGPSMHSADRGVRIQNGIIRQEVSGLIHRGPKDRMLARQGWKEGPVLAVSARPGLNYSQPVSIADARKNESWAAILKRSSADLLSQLENPATREVAKRHMRDLGFFVTEEKDPRIVRWSSLDILDSSHEIGALLMLAQQRARNAKSDQEPRIGKGKWWVEAPRYGGHVRKGEEIAKPLYSDDMTSVVEEAADDMAVDEVEKQELIRGPIDPEASVIAIDHDDKRSLENGKRNSEKSERKIPKELRQFRARRDVRWQPPKAIWDPKTSFMPVGKGSEQEFDHVYLVSSLFHHVSILRLRVHPSMLSYIASTDKNTPRPPPEHYGLWVSRTRWFDLLNAEDRVEATRGLWGVMVYLMRDTDTPRPEDWGFATRLIRAGL